MTDQFIYFVGKPYPYPAAIQLIRRMGYKVGLFHDKNASLSSQEIYDNIIEVDFETTESLLESLPHRKLQPKGLVCTYENYILARSRLANYFGLPAPDLKSSTLCTDKYLMRQAFLSADPNITPKFGLATTSDEVLALAEEMGYPVILKPTNLVKSLLVLRCNDRAELEHNFSYAQEHIAHLYKKYQIYDRKPQLIIEQYILGKTCSVAAFVDKEGVPYFCEGITSLKTAQEIGFDDNFLYSRTLPGEFDKQLADQIFEVARKGVAALGMTSSPAHVELIYNHDGVKLIEIGARIGGYRPRMYELSYGEDLIKQEILSALGQKPTLKGKLKAYSATFELFPSKEGLYKNIEGEVDTSAFSYFSVKARPGTKIGAAKNGYKAAAVIMVSSPDKQQFNKLCSDVYKLKVVTA